MNQDKTTYFCVSCKSTITKGERVKFGRGGVCPDCYARLTDETAVQRDSLLVRR